MKKKLLSMIMIVSISICAVACGSDKTSEQSTTATNIAEETTKETNAEVTIEAVTEETITVKEYDYPTTIEEAAKEFGFPYSEASKFLGEYWANGDFMREFPTTVLAHFDYNSNNGFEQEEFEAIRNWTYMYYNTKIEGVSNNDTVSDEIEIMYMYHDYLTNGIFTFDTVYEDGSEVDSVNIAFDAYYAKQFLGKAKSDEEAYKLYDITYEEAYAKVDEWYAKLETTEQYIELLNIPENIVNYFDKNSDNEIDMDEWSEMNGYLRTAYDAGGTLNNNYEDYEYLNFYADIINDRTVIPYFSPDGDLWLE